MRINKYLAHATGISRRNADELIAQGHVGIDGATATPGDRVTDDSVVTLKGKTVEAKQAYTTIMLNKPIGYICSRVRQGQAPTIYSLLPKKYHGLKPIGRLDKQSRGLILLTDDGELAHRLAHPTQQKEKIYVVKTHREISKPDLGRINKGVKLDDGVSHMQIESLGGSRYKIRMSEGRNRQIRRTMNACSYEVLDLKRVVFGAHELEELKEGSWKIIES